MSSGNSLANALLVVLLELGARLTLGMHVNLGGFGGRHGNCDRGSAWLPVDQPIASGVCHKHTTLCADFGKGIPCAMGGPGTEQGYQRAGAALVTLSTSIFLTFIYCRVAAAPCQPCGCAGGGSTCGHSLLEANLQELGCLEATTRCVLWYFGLCMAPSAPLRMLEAWVDVWDVWCLVWLAGAQSRRARRQFTCPSTHITHKHSLTYYNSPFSITVICV